jgi:Icc-related predicted phosphoesterase
MGNRSFSSDDCIALGEQHYKWLAQTLATPTSCEHTVALTHFAPSLNVANPNYPIDEMSAYFCSSFDELIKMYQPDIWVFGHTHANFDLHMGATRILSNQHGYGKECQSDYQPNGIIVL